MLRLSKTTTTSIRTVRSLFPPSTVQLFLFSIVFAFVVVIIIIYPGVVVHDDGIGIGVASTQRITSSIASVNAFGATQFLSVGCYQRYHHRRQQQQQQQQQQGNQMQSIGRKVVFHPTIAFTTTTATRRRSTATLFAARSIIHSASSHKSAFGMASRKRPATTTILLQSSISSSASSPTATITATADKITAKQSLPQTPPQQQRPLVIVLAGPTAVGKSDVAAELCTHSMALDILVGHSSAATAPTADAAIKTTTNATMNATTNKNNNNNNNNYYNNSIRGHVVSADSVQAYRGVDIGANKPTAAEMERTPHHLVNVVDPPSRKEEDEANQAASSYNAADWMRDARYVIGKLTMIDNNASDNHIGDGDDDGDDDGVNNDEGYDDDDDDWKRDKESIERRTYIDAVLKKSLDNISGLDDAVDSTTATATTTTNHYSNQHRQPILPVVVGGTMMYLQWLVHGRPDAVRPTKEAVELAANKIDEFQKRAALTVSSNIVESPSPEKDKGERNGNGNGNGNDDSTSCKQQLDDNVSRDSIPIIDETDALDAIAWEEASAHVSSLGPIFLQRVQKLCGRDWYRLRRLLEVAYTIASKKKTTANNNKSEEDILRNLTEKEIYTGIRSGSLPEQGYDVRCFFLCPNDRMVHFKTVDQRCEDMLLRGLLRETASLYVNGGLPEDSQVTRAIGYRQALDYLKREGATSKDHATFLSFVDDFATATRQYGKKQMQWFRRDEEFAFIPVPMEWEKGERVGHAAGIIADMCKLPRVEFEAELLSSSSSNAKSMKNGSDGDDNMILPLSAQTKLENERQGKKMKFFASKREKLIENSADFLNVLEEADECTKLVQGLEEL